MSWRTWSALRTSAASLRRIQIETRTLCRTTPVRGSAGCQKRRGSLVTEISSRVSFSRYSGLLNKKPKAKMRYAFRRKQLPTSVSRRGHSDECRSPIRRGGRKDPTTKYRASGVQPCRFRRGSRT